MKIGYVTNKELATLVKQVKAQNAAPQYKVTTNKRTKAARKAAKAAEAVLNAKAGEIRTKALQAVLTEGWSQYTYWEPEKKNDD